MLFIYGQIYAIRNMIDGKVYIGQTTKENVLKRYKGNIANTHNVALKEAINIHGKESFEILTLCWCESKEELDKKEIEYIKEYNAIDERFGYNLAYGGIGGTLSQSVLKKISDTQKQVWENNPERRRQMSLAYSGENNPMHRSKGGHKEETKRKMSEIKKEKMANGEVVISEKCRLASQTKEALRNRVLSASKHMYIQYDENMNEVQVCPTLKDLYEYMKNGDFGLTVNTYSSFKNATCKNSVFNENGYNGYYYKKVNKEDYVNTEVS